MAANYLGRIAQYGLVVVIGFGGSAAYASRSDTSRLERYTAGLSTKPARKVELARDYSSLEGHLFAVEKTVPDRERGTLGIKTEVSVHTGIVESRVKVDYEGPPPSCILIPEISEGNDGAGDGSSGGSGNGGNKADGPLSK